VQQTTLRGQLTMLGISKVEQASNAEDALRLIRAKPLGLILCDFNLNSKTDGQQMFEHLRDKGLLPVGLLFFVGDSTESELRLGGFGHRASARCLFAQAHHGQRHRGPS
ncbi:MAG: response regulator, partial [Ideonella sp.]|nr:response regulator [Ideonella sp.]